MNEDANSIRNVVARKLRGLPADIEEPQIREEDRKAGLCRERCGRKVAEKGSQAHAQGLCVECATFMRRHGDWHTPAIPGVDDE